MKSVMPTPVLNVAFFVDLIEYAIPSILAINREDYEKYRSS